MDSCPLPVVRECGNFRRLWRISNRGAYQRTSSRWETHTGQLGRSNHACAWQIPSVSCAAQSAGGGREGGRRWVEKRKQRDVKTYNAHAHTLHTLSESILNVQRLGSTKKTCTYPGTRQHVVQHEGIVRRRKRLRHDCGHVAAYEVRLGITKHGQRCNIKGEEGQEQRARSKEQGVRVDSAGYVRLLDANAASVQCHARISGHTCCVHRSDFPDTGGCLLHGNHPQLQALPHKHTHTHIHTYTHTYTLSTKEGIRDF